MLPMERLTEAFYQMVFPMDISLGIAGGGCKAFYALGVGHEMKRWGIRFREVSGVSAGAAMALCLVGDREEDAVEYFEEITRRNDKNFKISNLFFGERVFPHESMYRRTIRYAMNWEKIKHSGIKAYIITVRAFPKKEESLKAKFEIAKLIAETAQAYIKDEKDRLDGKKANRTQEILRKWNMTEVVFTEKDFQSPEILEQIIMNSSSIPPVVSLQNSKNEYYIDGGLTNNLALEFFDKRLPRFGIYYEDTTLIGKDKNLLKNCYLIKPSRTLPITSFDYTNPTGVRETYELGKEDAKRQKSEIIEFIRQQQFLSLPQFFQLKV
jgi:predicted patatin/cPLA2 family phospholipase